MEQNAFNDPDIHAIRMSLEEFDSFKFFPRKKLLEEAGFLTDRHLEVIIFEQTPRAFRSNDNL